MATIMVTKTSWIIILSIQHVVQISIFSVVVGEGGSALRIEITCNHYGYKTIMHINSSDYRFLGDKVHLVVMCRGNGTRGGFTIKKLQRCEPLWLQRDHAYQ